MKYLFFSFAFITLFTSCSPKLTPMTEAMVDEMDWSSAEFERIQFYLSDDIVLRREARSGDASIREGKIRVINGRKIEEIIFEKGTPGVFVFSPNDENVAISFEDGGQSRYLMFGPSPKFNDRYVLLAKDWDRRSGKITYDGQVYNTTSESAFASLMVDLKHARQSTVKSRRVKGRTVE